MINKRLLIPVFALALPFLVTSCNSEGTSKKDVEVEGTLTYESNGSGVTVTGVSNDISTVTSINVPTSYNGQNVTKVKAGAFKGASKLKSLTIPFVGSKKGAKDKEGLLGYVFGQEQYENGYKTEQLYDWDEEKYYFLSDYYYIPQTLREVVISGTQESIPFGAFSNCYFLNKLDFSNAKTIEVDSLGFYHCEDLETVVLPETLQEIGNYSFGYCYRLTDLTFPKKVSYIGPRAFSYCTSLHDVIFKNEETTYVDSFAFYHCNNSVRFGDENYINDLPVFYFYGDVNLNAPYGYTFVPDVQGLSLNNIFGSKPGSYKADDSMYYNVITNYTGYKAVDSNTKLEYAISKPDGVDLTATVTRYVGNDGSTASKTIEIPNTVAGEENSEVSVNSIGNYAFINSSDVKEVIFSKNLKNIGNYVIADSSVQSVDLSRLKDPKTEYSFLYSNLAVLNIPSYVTNGTYADKFYTKVKSKYYDDPVKYLAFTQIEFDEGSNYNPTNYNNPLLSSSTTNIISSIKFNGQSSFGQYDTNNYCLSNLLKNVNTTTFKSLDLGTSSPLSYIPAGQFNKFTNFTKLKLGENSSLAYIGESAFSTNALLPTFTSIDLKNASSLAYIGDSAFKGCSSLVSIETDEKGKAVSTDLFDLSKCENLVYIGDSAFSGCTGISEIKLPASLFPSTPLEDGPFGGINVFYNWGSEITQKIYIDATIADVKANLTQSKYSTLTEDVDFELDQVNECYHVKSQTIESVSCKPFFGNARIYFKQA